MNERYYIETDYSQGDDEIGFQFWEKVGGDFWLRNMFVSNVKRIPEGVIMIEEEHICKR